MIEDLTLNIFTILGIIILAWSIGGLMGGFVGRNDMLKNLGMTWEDYRRRLGGRRPY